MPDTNARFRVMNLPTFPKPNDAQEVESRFSAESLLGGFLVAPENRFVEIAIRFAEYGAPVFDRPIGNAPLTPIVDVNRAPSRADLEFIMRAVQDSNDAVDEFFPNAVARPSPLFSQSQYNSALLDPSHPRVVGYRKLEETSFLMPLVFYGQSGAGKTRVIEAICQMRREKEPQKTLYYLSAHDFARSLNDAIRTERTQLFRELFGQASVVAIENADIFTLHRAAQEEFLDMLDDAIQARKLVILSFSQPPNKLEGLTPELAARLSSGLLVPVNIPSDETREDIISIVANKLALPLDRTALDFCARKLPSTVSTICASLVQIARELAMTKSEPTVENIRMVLERREEGHDLTVDQIVRATAKRLSLSVLDLRGKKRSQTLVFGRKCVVFLARRLTNATYVEIGRALSHRNHSTILHAANEIEDEIKTNEESLNIIREIAKALDARMNF